MKEKKFRRKALQLFLHPKSSKLILLSKNAIKPSLADNDQFPHCESWQSVADMDARSNQEYRHGLIGKFPILIVSRRYRCEESHPGHPGETTEAAVWVSLLYSCTYQCYSTAK